jgi:hypothetical protein
MSVTAQGSKVLDPVTGSGTVDVISGIALSGNATLGPIMGMGSASVLVQSQAASTLGAVVGSGTGAMPLTGGGAGTLGDVAGTGASSVKVTASAVGTLDAILGTAQATMLVTGGGSVILGAVTGTGLVGADQVLPVYLHQVHSHGALPEPTAALVVSQPIKVGIGSLPEETVVEVSDYQEQSVQGSRERDTVRVTYHRD